LKWRRCVPRKRHDVDRPAKREGAIFKCIGAAKDFRVTERGNIKILKNGFAISLVKGQAVEQKHYPQRLIFRCDSGSSNGNLRNFSAIFRLKEDAWGSLQQISEV